MEMDTREDDVRQIVPWFSTVEWSNTAKSIYSANAADRAEGLEILRLWRVRCEVLPTGVDTTLILLSALANSSQEDDVDDLGQRLALSAALTRFLNHALMAGQKDPFSHSMFQKAKSANLPNWMVKLRHEAAHGRSIPALEPLIEAANAALDWLKENYWHQPPLDWKPKEPPLDSLIDKWEALSACLQAGYRKIASLPDENLKTSNLKCKTVHHAIEKAEAKIFSASAKNPDYLLNAILCSQTFLTPPAGLYGTKELPAALINQWQPLLALIHSARLLPALILQLHEKDTKLASAWITFILEVFMKLKAAQKLLRSAAVVIKDVPSTSKFVQKKSEGRIELEVEKNIREEVGLEAGWPLFVAAPTLEEASKLAVEVASRPKKNANVYLNKILELAETDQAKIDQINQLWSISLGNNTNMDIDGEVKSLEDLLQTIPVYEDSDKWIKISEWHPKSLGLLPWQEGYVDLTLDFER